MDSTLQQLITGLVQYQARQNELLQENADLKAKLAEGEREAAARKSIYELQVDADAAESAKTTLSKDDALQPTEVPSIFHNKPRPKQAEPFA